MAELFYKTISWDCKSTWRKSASNTLWCLLGCSIGDFGTILFFQLSGIPFPIMGVMALAIVNGLITSVLLETFILLRQMTFSDALKTAFGMSFISMLAMELSMNTVDLVFAGGSSLVGSAFDAHRRLSCAMAIQLLSVEEIWCFLPLKNYNGE